MESRDCAQVVILSHDQNFLKLVWDELQADERKTLQLFRISEKNTGIAEWDIEKAVQAPYKADIDTLSKFYSANVGSPRDVVQKNPSHCWGFGVASNNTLLSEAIFYMGLLKAR